MNSRYAGWWLMLAGTLFALANVAVYPPQKVMELMSETGWVEQSTAAGWFLLAGLVWLLRRRDDPPASSAALSAMFLAFGARELDWHRAFTGTTVLRVSYYFGPAPLQHKLAALGVLTVVSLAMLRLLLTHARQWWRAFRGGDAVAISIAAFIVTLVASKLLDRSYNVLNEDFHMALSMSTKVVVSALEETLELTLTLIALLALWQHRSRRAR
ncbi:hypothetical protein [Piscinibacter sp.]|uniref:hypothetical protein n=1 Tax=Piscinibacter sp. TaxID=1903157 RepID=UPI0039E50F2D